MGLKLLVALVLPPPPAHPVDLGAISTSGFLWDVGFPADHAESESDGFLPSRLGGESVGFLPLCGLCPLPVVLSACLLLGFDLFRCRPNPGWRRGRLPGGLGRLRGGPGRFAGYPAGLRGLPGPSPAGSGHLVGDAVDKNLSFKTVCPRWRGVNFVQLATALAVSGVVPLWRKARR